LTILEADGKEGGDFDDGEVEGELEGGAREKAE